MTTSDEHTVSKTPKSREVSDALTYQIIGAAQKVHRTLGPGFTERTYHQALCKKLMMCSLAFESEREYEVYYEGVLCGTYRSDLTVDGTVIVELKAVAELAKEHRMQTISYLRASGLPIALLLNFGSTSLESRRFENKTKK